MQALESGVNDVLFVGAAIFFLLTVEGRIKRRRALRAIHELRAIAHVIDMHQLTKDPEWVLDRGRETGVLPARTMSRFELSRYLDYCSEALSLTGKVAALYIQGFDDPRRAAGGERGRGPDDRPLAQDLAEADDPLLDARGGRLAHRRLRTQR